MEHRWCCWKYVPEASGEGITHTTRSTSERTRRGSSVGEARGTSTRDSDRKTETTYARVEYDATDVAGEALETYTCAEAREVRTALIETRSEEILKQGML